MRMSMNIGEILKNQMIEQEKQENELIFKAKMAFLNGGEIIVSNRYFTESFTKVECDFQMVEKSIKANDFKFKIR